MLLIRSAIASLLILTVPIATGWLAINFVALVSTRKVNKKCKGSDLLGLYFPTGAAIIYATTIAVYRFADQSAFQRSFLTLSCVFVGLSLAALFALALHLITKGKNLETNKQGAVKDALVFIFCFAIALISQFVWKWKSGVLSSLDWDTFFHQSIVNNITSGKFSLVLSQLSDSVRVDAYTSIFHTLIAVPFSVFKPEILSFWWFAGFFQLVLIIFTSYSLGKTLYSFVEGADKENGRFAGMVTAIFGAFSFASFLAYNPYFLIPQILAATILVNGLISLFIELHKGKFGTAFIKMLPPAVFSIACHYVIGIFGVGILIITFLVWYLHHLFPTARLPKLASYLSLATVFVAPIVLRYVNLSFINPQEAGYYISSLKDVAKYMTNFYAYLWIPFLILGLAYLFRKSTVSANVIIVLVLVNITVLVSPIPYSLKFLAFGSFVFHLVMGLGVVYLTKKLSDNPILRGLLVFGLAAGLLFNLTNNIIVYKQTPAYMETFTHVSDNEVAAANFIKNSYGNSNSMVVSDTATMFILEGLSGVNSPGGAYANPNVRKVLAELYFSSDTQTMTSNILSIADGKTGQADKYLFVLSHRYFEWLSGSEDQIYGYYFNVWQPRDLKIEDYNFIEFLREKAKLPVVYSNPGLVVFEISR